MKVPGGDLAVKRIIWNVVSLGQPYIDGEPDDVLTLFDLRCDDMDLLRLAIDLEKEFHISLQSELRPDMTVKQVCDCVRSYYEAVQAMMHGG